MEITGFLVLAWKHVICKHSLPSLTVMANYSHQKPGCEWWWCTHIWSIIPASKPWLDRNLCNTQHWILYVQKHNNKIPFHRGWFRLLLQNFFLHGKIYSGWKRIPVGCDSCPNTNGNPGSHLHGFFFPPEKSTWLIHSEITLSMHISSFPFLKGKNHYAGKLLCCST